MKNKQVGKPTAVNQKKRSTLPSILSAHKFEISFI